jgi:hypothetical protein
MVYCRRLNKKRRFGASGGGDTAVSVHFNPSPIYFFDGLQLF